VGTGFHPELTGRENIFLNGAILGMSRAEIRKHFDAIVDFAEIEKFLDTPVKRYSSGMYVRLAFAVAAHLEPEILVVDEVLAVGDAQFQKKCLGKMEDVSMNEGRTVLFVSHNMTALNSLCNKAIFLKSGEIVKTGLASDVINYYLSVGTDITTYRKWESNELPGDDVVKLLEVKLIDHSGNNIDVMDIYKGGGIEFTYEIIKEGYKPIPNLHLFNQRGDCVFIGSESAQLDFKEKGKYAATVWIPAHLLNDGRYIAGIAASTMIPERIHFFEKEALIFDVIEDMNLRHSEYRGPIPGIVRPKLEWQTKIVS
jgi:lipopolysaccharide transport system ATP-binding protein